MESVNPDAVEALAKLKLSTAKVIWMLVFDSKADVLASGQNRQFVNVSENGTLTANTLATLDAVAKHGYSLATSHLGADVALLIVRAARTRNIPVVVTHAAQICNTSGWHTTINAQIQRFWLLFWAISLRKK